MGLIWIKHVLLAVAKSQSLPGAPEWRDEARDWVTWWVTYSFDIKSVHTAAGLKTFRQEEKRKRMWNLKEALAGFNCLLSFLKQLDALIYLVVWDIF